MLIFNIIILIFYTFASVCCTFGVYQGIYEPIDGIRYSSWYKVNRSISKSRRNICTAADRFGIWLSGKIRDGISRFRSRSSLPVDTLFIYLFPNDKRHGPWEITRQTFITDSLKRVAWKQRRLTRGRAVENRKTRTSKRIFRVDFAGGIRRNETPRLLDGTSDLDGGACIEITRDFANGARGQRVRQWAFRTSRRHGKRRPKHKQRVG